MSIVNKIKIGDGELLIMSTGGTIIENDNMLPFIFDIPINKLHYITSNNLDILSGISIVIIIIIIIINFV
jgi:hypothetical protein